VHQAIVAAPVTLQCHVTCDVTGRPQNNGVVASMASLTVESCRRHVTDEGVVSDVSNNIGDQKARQSLLLGCIDDVTSLRPPASKNIKVFVCSTGTGD